MLSISFSLFRVVTYTQPYCKGTLEALPYGPTRAVDLIPQVLCGACGGTNLGPYVFYKESAYRGGPVPRSDAPPTVVDVGKFETRIQDVLAAVANTTGQQRKSSVADNFDGFVRARTQCGRGWKTATDVEVFECLCWLDSQGRGTKLVHAPTSRGGDRRQRPLCAKWEMREEIRGRVWLRGKHPS